MAWLPVAPSRYRRDVTASDQQALATVAVYVAGVLLVRWVAKRKGYNPSPWVLGALVFWPAALLLILFKPKNPKLFRRCPDCGSTDVPYNVPVCRHCGRDERVQAQRSAPPATPGEGEAGGAQSAVEG
jgi:hypothetical protein